MQVILAETAGFCMGVSLALKKLNDLVEENDDGSIICTLGPIIHNPQVLACYEAKGVRQIDSPDQAPDGSKIVIRAHGIPRETEENLNARNVEIFDATCPKVKKAQLLIARQTERGRSLLLYGEENHPEVRGLLSYATDDALVFDSLEELEGVIKPGKNYFLAAQTTQDKKVYKQIKEFAANEATTLVPVLETICNATKVRQQEAIAIAGIVDKMVVAGGFNSGNTRRLAKVVAEQGVDCYHVETVAQLNPEDFKGAKKIGLTAGASTPDSIIQEIYSALETMNTE